MATPPNRTEPAGRAAKAGAGNSIAAGGRLEGTFRFSGPVIIGAEIRGDVESDDLILVEATGRIEGRVRAATLIVHGAVAGDIEASRALEVCTGGRLEGFAFSPSMRVEERTIVSADLLIAPERTVAHINKAATVPDLYNVAPLAPARPETPAGDTAVSKSAAG
ncbi:MAG: polymer-forming cytoskeletal protein [Hyphomonas sp.]|uniref:bactofilin family protein n=1 Tax=Hyphomonas sp. TaxID=87 RepID=UPI00182A3B6E|nr:polymer-forming cytoskeletal protein [Hyphomonas sp.]MBA3068377.1 polymer-forming cytoskeletal protein [Hyphomonas sp.]MBU4060756.1 polymer-forming cytoskeletal protein [Alphaproteobacteria bacterium]MBU4164740.1 polymer-forming cytoskeletal protein [Alphaproteobacteria bacterium]MBU4568308.1 polymer-forming cytoskeletal protein [Alphaproteobacteria bacterium]